MALTERQKEHREYLKTPKWKEIRLRKLQLDDFCCQRCPKKAVQVHHLTYKNWKNERMEDLQSLCAGCHRKIHFNKDGSRKPNNDSSKTNGEKNKNIKGNSSQKSNGPVKLNSRMRKITKFIKNLRGLPENPVGLSKAGRALLMPHSIEILDWFGFQGETYHQKLADMKIKKFDKEELIQKLLTLSVPYNQYLARVNNSLR